MARPYQIIKHGDAQDLVQAVAKDVCEQLSLRLEKQERVSLALSGGSTPKQLYRTLTQAPWRERFPWQQTDFYFGDERAVPPDHIDSNYRMARENLFANAPVDTHQIFAMPGEADNLRLAAHEYSRLLRHRLAGNSQVMPVFDVVLLGMGDDGHTASLFPGTCALHETERPCVAVYVPKLKTWRLTLTFPVLNAARAIRILVTGAAKQQVVGAIFNSSTHSEYPIQKLQPHAQLRWHVDETAAGQIEGSI